MFCRLLRLLLLYKKTTKKAMKSQYGISTFYDQSMGFCRFKIACVLLTNH